MIPCVGIAEELKRHGTRTAIERAIDIEADQR
jgi:hypothetical protein